MNNKIIGLVKETKNNEGRVALTPNAVNTLISKGFTVYFSENCGAMSGFSNYDYTSVGAKILPSNKEVYENANFIVKVKEPIDDDLQYLNDSHTLFCYLHLASSKELTKSLMDKGVTAYSFETLEVNNQLPLLKPMSQIAGRVSVQLAIQSLMSSNNGLGLLIGGKDGQSNEVTVSVIGAGTAGYEAAKMASDIGANVKVFDINQSLLDRAERYSDSIKGFLSNEDTLGDHLHSSHIIIGSVLIPGDAAPKIINDNLLHTLSKGTILVDIAIDQGGCVEGIQPTNYSSPSYEKDGLIYIAVTNLPGGVCRTSTEALSEAILPYIEDVYDNKTSINTALNIDHGEIVLDSVKKLFDL